MKKDNLDYIAKVEQAIADKYGDEAIQNPKAEWDENKEKVYLEQMRDLYKKQKKNDEANDKVEVNGIKVSRKLLNSCLLYTSPSPRDATLSRMPSSA